MARQQIKILLNNFGIIFYLISLCTVNVYVGLLELVNPIRLKRSLTQLD